MTILSKKDAALFLGVKEATLMLWLAKGKLNKSVVTYVGRKVCFLREKLEAWLEAGGTGAPPKRKGGGGFKKKAPVVAVAVKEGKK